MRLLKFFLLVASLNAVAFGGGNTLLAGLERALVLPGIITPSQFAAAVALGQATPGPLAAFTTAVGSDVMGVPGAIAATLALVVVSLISVLVIRRVPAHWFTLPAVRGGLAAVQPFATALLLYLAYKIVMAGERSHLAVPVLIVGVVVVGRLKKVPTAMLVIGGVFFGMLIEGTPFAGW